MNSNVRRTVPEQLPGQSATRSAVSTVVWRVVAIVVAAALGAAAGALAVSMLSAEKFAWSGIALVPLFIVLEALLKHVVFLFGNDPSATRVSLAGAIVVGFYAAWFALQSA